MYVMTHALSRDGSPRLHQGINHTYLLLTYSSAYPGRLTTYKVSRTHELSPHPPGRPVYVGGGITPPNALSQIPLSSMGSLKVLSIDIQTYPS